MNWEKILNDHTSLQEYRLTDDHNDTLILKYNPLHHSARVTYGYQHRLFYLEGMGSITGKILLKNEYGMETGSLVYDRSNTDKGTLVIDDIKSYFQVRDGKLVIYDKETDQSITNCSLPVSDRNSWENLHTNNMSIPCYILGLCWYLCLPASQKNTFKYATAS